jgi:hypothetical protein
MARRIAKTRSPAGRMRTKWNNGIAGDEKTFRA